MRTVAFIGTGNMGGALAQAACRALSPAEVVLTNRTPKKADALARQLGCVAVLSNEAAVRSAKYIFLGVKPQFYPELAKELTPVLRSCHEDGDDKVLISMAAGLTLDTLRTLYSGVGYDIPILRIMPNTCVTIGEGIVALAGKDEAHLTAVENILRAAGLVERSVTRCRSTNRCAVQSYCAVAVGDGVGGEVRKGQRRQKKQQYQYRTENAENFFIFHVVFSFL